VGGGVGTGERGDIVVEGVEAREGFMAPWSSMTLLSLVKRLGEGWEFYAKGLGGWLYKEGEVVPFSVVDGLMKPNDSNSKPDNDEQSHIPSWLGFFSGLKGKMRVPKFNIRVLVLLVALVSLFSGVSGESHELSKCMSSVEWGSKLGANPNPTKKSRVHRVSNDRSDSILMHAKKGHPHDPLCDICMHARMRGKCIGS